MISVFTPSHDSHFLDEAYQSLVNQTVADWEWTVLLNGKASWQAPSDPRIKVSTRPDITGVGAAKCAAIKDSSGDILVELDHDDILAPAALENVVEALENGYGFAYSDSAQIEADGGYCHDLFDMRNGWEYEDEVVFGRKVLRCKSMKPTPHNISYIWYAPNHLRAFTRDAYLAAGGYNPRDILDDQDFMCRLYQHTDFRHIDKCLYLQRMHGGNTQRDQATNARIQSGTIELYDQYIQANALTWAKRHGLPALDLGAAHNKAPGYLGIDQYKTEGVDIVCNICDGLPFADGEVGVIRAVDFLEHIPDKIAVMNEIYRVLAPGGMFLSLTPSTDGRGAWQDPTHVSGWNENSWWYFTDANYARFCPEIKCRFQTSRLTTYFPSPWHADNKISYVCANMIALKDGMPRQGGFINW